MNKPKDLEQVLMTRDGVSFEEARAMVNEASDELLTRIYEEGTAAVDATEFMLEWFGVEEDYLFDLFY